MAFPPPPSLELESCCRVRKERCLCHGSSCTQGFPPGSSLELFILCLAEREGFFGAKSVFGDRGKQKILISFLGSCAAPSLGGPKGKEGTVLWCDAGRVTLWLSGQALRVVFSVPVPAPPAVNAKSNKRRTCYKAALFSADKGLKSQAPSRFLLISHASNHILWQFGSSPSVSRRPSFL